MEQKKEKPKSKPVEFLNKSPFGSNVPLKNEHFVVIIILLVAFIIRKYMQVRLFPDSIYYLTFSKNIINGIHNAGGSSLARFKWSPLYPHLVALFSLGNSTPGHLVETARQVSVFAGSLLVIPVYFLSRNMFNTASAILAAVLIAVTPEFLYFSGAVLTESTATLFIGISLLLIWRANLVSSGKLRLLIHSLLGISLGLSFLARHATIGFLPITIGWLSVIGFREYKSDVTVAKLKKTGICILIVIVSFFATLSPQIFYLHSETGKWAVAVDPTSGFARKLEAAGKNLRYTQSYEAWHSLSEDSSKYIWEAEETPGLLSTIVNNPGNFIKGYTKTLFGGYLPDTYPLPYPNIIVAFVLAGILFLIFKRKFRQLIFLIWGFGGYYAFLALFQNMRDRYMFPVFPLLVIISSAGAFWIIQEGIKFTKKISTGELVEKVSLCIVIILFVIVILPTSISLIKIQNRMSKTSLLFRLGEQIAPKIEEGAVIFDRNPHLTFFSGGIPTIVPYAEIDQVIKFGQITGVKYWFIESGYVPRLRPQFRSLLDPSMAPDALRPVTGFSNDNYRLIVYEILTE